MTWTQVSNNWTAFSAPILQRWPELDENRLINIAGDRRLLAAEIADKHTRSEIEADEEIAEWLNSEMPADVMADEHNDNMAILRSAEEIPEGEGPLDDDKTFGDDNKLENPVGRA